VRHGECNLYQIAKGIREEERGRKDLSSHALLASRELYGVDWRTDRDLKMDLD
jgi:hypothetical protein